MGIITEAVINNLEYAIKECNTALKNIDIIEASLHIGFRSNFANKESFDDLIEAKNRIVKVKEECLKKLQKEKEYE